jgi:hypothetical protein
MKLTNLKPNNQYITSHHIDIQFILDPILVKLFESTWLNGYRITMDNKCRNQITSKLKPCYFNILDQVVENETNRY